MKRQRCTVALLSIFLLMPCAVARPASLVSRERPATSDEPRGEHAQVPQSAPNSAAEILRATGFQGGLVVHVGCGGGQLTAGLRANDSTLVQGLDTSADNVAEARRHVRSLGLYGPVTVDAFGGEHLPYTDDVVNLLVVSVPYRLSPAEMLRVLAPRGVAYVRDGDDWRKLVKPWPANRDEWTHYLHGPDNNAVARDTVVGPPRHMQWLAGPLWTRNHHKLCSVSSVVAAQGRIFCVVDEASPANINLPGDWAIMARDAFNGLELWRRPMASWAWHGLPFRSGPPQVTRLLVASGNRVYAPLRLNAPISALDAATGKTLNTFAETGGAEEIVLADGVLLVLKGAPVAQQAFKHAAFADTFRLPNTKSLVAIEAEKGRRLWEWSDPALHPLPETLASAAGRVYLQVGEGVLCLDLQSGATLWTTEAAEKVPKPSLRMTFGKSTLVVAGDVVLCNLAGRLTALSARTGETLWDCPAGGGFHSPLDVFVIDGVVWQGLHTRDSVAPPAVQDFSEGRDLHTGRVVRTNQVLADLQTAGHHHRCYREKATVQYILAGKRGIEFLDLEGDDHSRNNWIRGACQYGVLPANGLIYAPPHSCGCYMESKLYGFWAVAAGQADMPRVPDAERLEKGAAYDSGIEAGTGDRESWPQYQHDPLRSGVASTVVPTRLQPVWQAKVGGTLTPAVIAGGKVLVCDRDADTVYALDEADGKVAWRYVAGGTVDSPPAVYQGLVLFGSADGRVHCLRLTDGQLLWRFLAAPRDLRTVARQRIESLWPVHGSVLILNGAVYCSAGRSTWLDDGIDLYGLEPATGKVLYRNHYESRPPRYGEGKEEARPEYDARIDQNVTDYKTFLASDRSDAFSMAGGSIQDVLVSNGRDVFLHQECFDAQLHRQDRMKRHLFSTSNLLDDAGNHRSDWVLGTGDFSRIPVAYSWIVNRPGSRSPTIAVPTGVLLAYSDRAVWGVRRKGDANGKYTLFQKDNTPFDPDEESRPDFRKISPEQAQACIWQADLPVRTRALLKSGEHLFLGVMPVEIPPDDRQAAYEGRRGGAIWVANAADGGKVAEYELRSPVVWNGLAAAHGCLFLSISDGSVACWAR